MKYESGTKPSKRSSLEAKLSASVLDSGVLCVAADAAAVGVNPDGAVTRQIGVNMADASAEDASAATVALNEVAAVDGEAPDRTAAVDDAAAAADAAAPYG